MITRIIFFFAVASGLILGTALGYIPATIPIALGIALACIGIQTRREKKQQKEKK